MLDRRSTFIGFSHAGYRSEFRFHSLRGTIRLGSYANSDSNVVDSAVAETAFLNAARYANHDFPADASMALLCAGRAAYASKKLPDARRHFEAALKLSDFGELRYQLAKTLAALGRVEECLPHLEAAIRQDRRYAVKAGGDADFQSYNIHLNALLEKLRSEASKQCREAIAAYERTVAEVAGTHIESYKLTEWAKDDFSEMASTLEQGRDSASNGTYFGYLNAIDLCGRSAAQKEATILAFQRAVRSDLQKNILELEKANTSANAQKFSVDSQFTEVFQQKTVVILFGILAVLALIWIWSEGSKNLRVSDLIGLSIGGLIVTFIIAALVGGIVGGMVGGLIAGVKKATLESEMSARGSSITKLQSLIRTVSDLTFDASQKRVAALAGPKGTCPNCSASIPLDSETCPKCRAIFGSGSEWQIKRVS